MKGDGVQDSHSRGHYSSSAVRHHAQRTRNREEEEDAQPLPPPRRTSQQQRVMMRQQEDTAAIARPHAPSRPGRVVNRPSTTVHYDQVGRQQKDTTTSKGQQQTIASEVDSSVGVPKEFSWMSPDEYRSAIYAQQQYEGAPTLNSAESGPHEVPWKLSTEERNRMSQDEHDAAMLKKTKTTRGAMIASMTSPPDAAAYASLQPPVSQPQEVPWMLPTEEQRAAADSGMMMKPPIKVKKTKPVSTNDETTAEAVSPTDQGLDDSIPREEGHHDAQETIGAVAISGPGGQQQHGRSYESIAPSQQEPVAAPPQPEEQSTVLLSAVLVPPENQAPSAAAVPANPPGGGGEELPYAEAAVMPRNKRGRMVVILSFLLLAIAVVVVGVTVPLVLRSQSSSSSSETIRLTVVIQLDSRPQEIGWELECASETLVNFPPGVYQQPNSLVQVPVQVEDGSICSLTVIDTGDDGIENGFVQVFRGEDITDSASLVVVVPGDFTSPTSVTFSVIPGVTVPGATPEPSSSPTTEVCVPVICGKKPSAFETRQQIETFAPSLIATARPSLIATVAPTWAPTVVTTRQPTPRPATPQPTRRPTPLPTTSPTRRPTTPPPTPPPTRRPTTPSPTPTPTQRPTPRLATAQPSTQPSPVPTDFATMQPTQVQTELPTMQPSQMPTVSTAPEKCVTVQVLIIFDDFPEQTSWELKDWLGRTLDAGSGQGRTSGEWYEWSGRVAFDDILDFQISDSLGNGLCCASGFGEYGVELKYECDGENQGSYMAVEACCENAESFSTRKHNIDVGQGLPQRRRTLNNKTLFSSFGARVSKLLQKANWFR